MNLSLFLLVYFVFVTGLFIGMLVGFFARGKVIKEPTLEFNGGLADYPKETYSINQQKPGGIFKDEEAEIVERPTAAQLAKWNEDKDTREGKEAMSQTLSNDPHLSQTKKEYDRFIGGISE